MRLFAFCLIFISILAKGEFTVPPLRGHVNDQAKVISRGMELELNAILNHVKKSTQIELAILTIPSLEGESIEAASIKITDQWKLGKSDSDKGLLVLIAVKDRELRIEVGQGLEGDLPDASARRIIDQVMVPMLKEGRMDDAVFLGTYSILKKVAPDLPLNTLFGRKVKDADYRNVHKVNRPFSWWRLGFQIALFIFIILMGRGGLLGLFLGHAIGRGHYRSGGFGGGGFGGGLGGGGGFSGGGASGRW